MDYDIHVLSSVLNKEVQLHWSIYPYCQVSSIKRLHYLDYDIHNVKCPQ